MPIRARRDARTRAGGRESPIGRKKASQIGVLGGAPAGHRRRPATKLGVRAGLGVGGTGRGARGAGRGGPRRRAGPPAPGLAPGAPGCLGQARPLGLKSKNLVGTAPLVDSQVV